MIKITNIYNSCNSCMQILLVISHREYYPNIPLLPWLHGTEVCEHFFGMVRQNMPDFTYVDLIYLIPKIKYVFKAYMNSSITNENIENKVSKIG